ncbi:DUF2637 domain-containing protein [Streptomyces sp. x-80]|uniref:DUF2637 domain-containing protein n=1 Tax=Streptomyces sp. x-80 TaxID=2789282 RepID=UPI00397FE4FC
MFRKIRPDAVLIQAVIAGALSFAHLHDLAEAAGQDGWKAWAYPVSVDLLFVAAWHRLRTLHGTDGATRAAWTWFVIALAASLGANVATAGLLDLHHVPAWLRILVAGWPALAFLGGTLLAHAPATAPAEPETTVAESDPVLPLVPDPGPAPEVSVERAPEPTPEQPPVIVSAPVPAVAVPPALLDHARKVADTHRATTGSPIDVEILRTRLGVPLGLAKAITAQLA